MFKHISSHLCFVFSVISLITSLWIWGNTVVEALTHPLLAATPWESYQLRVGALISGPLQIITAQRYTGHPSSKAAAQLSTGRLKYLSLLQPPAIHLTAQLVPTWSQRRVGEEGVLHGWYWWAHYNTVGRSMGCDVKYADLQAEQDLFLIITVRA